MPLRWPRATSNPATSEITTLLSDKLMVVATPDAMACRCSTSAEKSNTISTVSCLASASAQGVCLQANPVVALNGACARARVAVPSYDALHGLPVYGYIGPLGHGGFLPPYIGAMGRSR